MKQRWQWIRLEMLWLSACAYAGAEGMCRLLEARGLEVTPSLIQGSALCSGIAGVLVSVIAWCLVMDPPKKKEDK